MLSTHGYFDPVPELGKTDTGGQVLYILKLARALARFDIKVDIYTRWFDRGRKQIDPLPGCPSARVVRIPAGDWEFIPKEFIYGVLPELAENMIEFIQEHDLDYDLFHGHYVDAGIVTLEVAGALDRPAFFTAHSLGAWKRERTGGDPVEMDKIFNFTHRVEEELRVFKSIRAQTITSMEELGKINELYGFEPPKVDFTPPGVDVELFRPLGEGEEETPTAVELPDEYIFAVSRISRAKGHNLLLPAFKLVAEERPDIHLVVAGGSKDLDDEEKEIMAYMNSFIEDNNNLKDRVHLIGGIPNPDLPPYYRRAKLFTMAARYEPFGMTALEAMSCQTPAVISKFAGLAENLEPGCDCLTVDPNVTEEYGGTMLSLLKDEALMRECAERGCLTTREEFSWEAIARKFIAFYDKHLDV
jgi:mannosylfructose-phosphate synthase